jgi:enoyl-CoA hydratase/carnithine racemase
MIGSECGRLGFATHYMKSEYMPRLIDNLENNAMKDQSSKQEMINNLVEKISGFLDFNIPVNHAMDAWVKKYFAGKTDINEILASLSSCLDQRDHCKDVFTSISERSPTALVLTLKLLRHNEGKPIADVFATELKAAKLITRHPDYIEGVRARLLDRNHKPKWTPDNLSKVDLKNFIS